MDLDTTLHLAPRASPPSLLFVYLHGVGASALDLAPAAERLARAFPQAIHLLPDGFEPFDAGPEGRQWFSIRDVSEANRPARVDAAVERLAVWLAHAQRHFGIATASTLLVGFSQGAIVALGAAQRSPAVAGRVIAIAGRYATLPEKAPETTVVHLVHGKDDAVVPARHAVEAATRLVALGGDVTADVVPGIGHALHPDLLDLAVGHLQTFVPRRIWEEAMAATPVVSTRASSRDLGPPD
jgi:phospholipase/carboxylesterase